MSDLGTKLNDAALTIRRQTDRIAALEAENATLEKRVADATALIQRTVDLYGKPGGPWNVPSEPGSWITDAQLFLGMKLAQPPEES